MRPLLEKHIERRASSAVLEALGVPHEKLGQHGYPDRIYWIPGGKPLLVEYKVPGELPRPLQQLRIDQLRQLGYDVEVHDNEQQTIDAVRNRLRAAKLSNHGHQVPY